MKYSMSLTFLLCLLPVTASAENEFLYPIAMVRAFPGPNAPKRTDPEKKQTPLKIGTAFLIDGGDKTKQWMVTCAHVVKYADAIRVDFSQTQWAIVTEVYIDEGHDLALLRLNKDAPPNLNPLNIRSTDLGADEKKLKVIGYARGIGPLKTKVSAERHGTIKGKEVGIRDSDLKFDPEAECFEVGVVGEMGSSGSALVDLQDQVIGVYIAGWNGKSSIGYCTSSRHLKEIRKAVRVTMNLDKNDFLGDLFDYERFSLDRVTGNAYTKFLQIDAPLVLGQIPANQVFDKFFKVNIKEADAYSQMMVDSTIGHSTKKINHVTSATSRCGFLVPEGYLLTERLEEDTGAYTLSISRKYSLNKARIYTRRLPVLPQDRSRDLFEFEQELGSVFSDVLKIMPVSPGARANRPGEAEIGPGSWPALYRDEKDGCLITFRVYFEPVRNVVHAYYFELCRTSGCFEVTGISTPISAFANAGPTEESKELEFVLASLYDAELGLERTKQLVKSDNGLIPVMRLPTPTPGTGPEGFKPGLPTTFPPIPGSRNPSLGSQQFNWNAQYRPGSANQIPLPPDNRGPVRAPSLAVEPLVRQVESEQWVPMQKPLFAAPPVQQQPAMAPVVAPAAQPEMHLAELGAYVTIIQLRDGSIGASLTRKPVANSPAASLWFGNQGPVSLQKGDTIWAIDSIPMGVVDLRRHFGPTSIDYSEATTGRLYRGMTQLPSLQFAAPRRP